MASHRYDITIWAPASSSLYLENGPATGGAELQMVLLARSLAALGLRVCHVVLPVGGLPDHRDGVDLVTVEPSSPKDSKRTILRHFMEALKLGDARVYLQRSAGTAAGVVGLFARAHGRAFIYSTSSDLDLTSGPPLALQERLATRVGLRCAHAVVVQTQRQAAAVEGRFNALQIPSFCEPSLARGDERDTFLWVGRAARYKNPCAFISLARAVSEARFVMVGIDLHDRQDERANEIAVAAEELDNLEVIPPLARSAILPLYERAVAVVNTSDFEGFPNTFLEGWARGALALSLTIDPDAVITHHGIGAVAGGSLSELASAARRMWRDRDRLDSARQKAMQYVIDHHAPQVVATRWLDLIRAVA